MEIAAGPALRQPGQNTRGAPIRGPRFGRHRPEAPFASWSERWAEDVQRLARIHIVPQLGEIPAEMTTPEMIERRLIEVSTEFSRSLARGITRREPPPPGHPLLSCRLGAGLEDVCTRGVRLSHQTHYAVSVDTHLRLE